MSDNREDQVLIVFVVDTSGSMGYELSSIATSLETMVNNLKLYKPEYLLNLNCAVITTDTGLKNSVRIVRQPQKVNELGTIKFDIGGDDTLDSGIIKGQTLIADYYADTEFHSPPILIAITDSLGSETIDDNLSKILLQDVNEGKYIFWTHVFSEQHDNFDHLKNLASDNIVVNYDKNKKLDVLLHEPLFKKLKELIRHQDEAVILVKRELDRNKKEFKKLLDINFKSLIKIGRIGLTIGFSVCVIFNIYIVFNIENNYTTITTNVDYNPEILIVENEFELDLKDVRNVLPPDVNVSVDLEYNYENKTVKEDCEDCGNTLILRYTLEDTISKYSLGSYHVISNETTRLSAQYVEKRIEKLLKKFDLRGAFKVKLQGETDSVRIGDDGIPYKGEFGTIAGEVYFNRTQKKEEMGGIYLTWKDTIRTNEELGFLRAYAFKKYLMQWTKPFIIKPPTFQYYIKTNKEKKGGNYRKVVIEVYFYSVIKKTDNYEISATK